MFTTQRVCARCLERLTDAEVREKHGWCGSCRSSPIVLPDSNVRVNHVAAHSYNNPGYATHIDASNLKIYYLFKNSFDTDAIMPSVEHPQWPDKQFFLVC